jgi:hypothetical protein
MDHEPKSTPEHIHSDTPESTQECLAYKMAIEQQLDDWCEMSKSHHPAIARYGIAHIIVQHCTPKERSNDDLEGTAFETGYTPKEVERIKQQRHQHDLISSIAQDTSFSESSDTDEEKTLLIHEHFEKVAFTAESSDSSPIIKDAIHYLRRIYTAENLFSDHLKSHFKLNPQDHKFVFLLSSIDDHIK